MKIQVFENTYETLLVGEGEGFDNNLFVTFRGTGHRATAKALKEVLEGKCPKCGGLNGKHSQLFRGRSNGWGDVEGIYVECPLSGEGK